jgi:hypothetical protein
MSSLTILSRTLEHSVSSSVDCEGFFVFNRDESMMRHGERVEFGAV